mgnify:CR=1 FL=1
MNDTVKQKLDKIYELYSSDRLQKSKQRFLDLDSGKTPKDRYPFCLAFPYFNPYNINHPPKERLEVYLDAFLMMYRFDDDTIPYIFPGLNHATIPSMFGAKEIRVGIETTAEKLIHSSEDAEALPNPKITPGSVAQRWLDTAAYLYEQTEGRIPISVCDMQGPFDSCAQMWSYDDMFISAYEDPDVYHSLLSKITDAFILLWKKQKEILGDAFMGTHLFPQGWLPPKNGAAVSADSLVMVSPDFYREFYVPYLKKIYEELGEITIHSCGDFRHLAKELSQTEGIVAINASQLTAKDLHEAGVDKKIELLLSVNYEDMPEQIRYVRDHGLNVRWSVNGVTPTSKEKFEHPERWTKEDFDETQRRIDKIKELMRI